MPSLIASGKLRKLIAQGFHGQLSQGVLRRASNYTMDEFGDTQYDGFVDYPFEGIRDSFDAKYRAQALIPETDVKLLILLGSVKPASANLLPIQTDQVFIAAPFNVWHQVREILEIDPAGASATLQVYQIPLTDVIS
jgi:hypothetical protein